MGERILVRLAPIASERLANSLTPEITWQGNGKGEERPQVSRYPLRNVGEIREERPQAKLMRCDSPRWQPGAATRAMAWVAAFLRCVRCAPALFPAHSFRQRRVPRPGQVIRDEGAEGDCAACYAGTPTVRINCGGTPLSKE